MRRIGVGVGHPPCRRPSISEYGTAGPFR